MRVKTLRALLKGYVWKKRGAALACIVTLVVATVVKYYLSWDEHTTTGAQVSAPTVGEWSDFGWGHETLAAKPNGITDFFIRTANACGLGATSCFRCHNGQRAPAPSSDETRAPWHVQHKSVNYSCNGCHGGNPRIIKKETAHKNLIAKPLASPAQSCFSCHTGSDASGLLDKYEKLAGGDQ